MKTHRKISTRLVPLMAGIGAVYGLSALPAQASSHREAPSITTSPKVDATDFYMFNSYEPGRTGFVTLIADYLPDQSSYGGPNYFKLDPNALYEIHVDNVGDAKEHITFQFRFKNALKAKTLSIGGKDVQIPLTQFGVVADPAAATLNVNETFTVDIIRGDRRSGARGSITNAAGGSATFNKPSDNIGTKTIPDYAGYAAKHIYAVNIPGCATPGKVFVGQRKDPFAVFLGGIFDLVNVPGVADFTPAEASFLLNPANKDAATDALKDKNVTSLALEVPTACLLATGSADTVIGGWTTASLRQGSLLSAAPKSGYQTAAISGGAWTQVSRLGMPLVNEVVIGLKDKDKFNGSEPKDDAANFAPYVTNPTLPTLLEILFGAAGVRAPTQYPRTDLITAFLTGVPSVNFLSSGTAPNNKLTEMVRLNTGIPATPAAGQFDLGAAACFAGDPPVLTLANPNCDPAGFPNGRRPGDDVVDITLRVAMGYLLPSTVAPNRAIPFHDAILQNQAQFDAFFPYLKTPMGGTP